MLTSETPSLDLLGCAFDQVATAMSNVGDRHRTAPTPCRSWTVDLLERHLIDGLAQFNTAARGGEPDFGRKPPEFLGDRAATFRSGADELLGIWRAKDLNALVSVPSGAVPVSFMVSQQITEFAVHGWDLVTATGQDAAGLDPAVAEAALAFAREALPLDFRGTEDEGKFFAPERPAPADAGPYERLAAFAGRV